MDGIEGPQDVKKLATAQLPLLAKELREKIVSVVSRTGGHLAPSLGAVDLAVALHYCFDSPRDKIIWDVGHQAYAHKLLTGRKAGFEQLRRAGGVSGFPRIDESEHDAFGTGHASTSISAAVGLACARDLKGEKHRVIAVIGDGALTGGLAFEGLNQAGHLKRDLIVILNDNKMSISDNVGALSQYMTRLISAPVYRRFEADVWELLGKVPSVGFRARGLARRIKESLKSLIVPGILFEELGFRYYGPVDGHDIEQMVEVLNHIKQFKGPQIVHVITTKGKGYSHAENDCSRFHGIGSFDKQTGIGEKTSDIPSYTEVFGSTLVEIAARRPDIVAVTAAMPDGTGLTLFRERFPERFFDVGIAEQHATTFSAGLARAGLKPVLAVYSTFLQRAFDQIVHDVALQRLPVAFAIDRGGLVGEDGPTHHGALDLSYLGQVPNMVVMAPKDENELRHMLATMVEYDDGPIAMRYPRDHGQGVACDEPPRPLEIGRGEVLARGSEVALFGIGSMVAPCLEAARRLAQDGVSAWVINARFVKPLDSVLICEVASTAAVAVTVEENVVRGGFGSAVAEMLAGKGICTPLLTLGLPDRFIGHGRRNELLDEVGLSSDGIVQAVKRRLSTCR
ncbi:MAG TPA: 1-deoxy-D-xylulose-5-phosphate synthase [bacterium]|nr:1-deoxy-D-xylulose-5-phosphate synthase [bacterium]